MFGLPLFGSAEDVAQFSDPATDPAAGYFPDGRVASDRLALSPVTMPEMYGTPSAILFQTGAYPERDDGPQYSWDQGDGRSPGQRWPHMPHREQYNFESPILGAGIMEGSTADLPADSNANPLLGKAERAGWTPLGPALAGQYYGQWVNQHQGWVEPVTIDNAPTIPLTDVAAVPW